MPVLISDAMLETAGLSEVEARVEIACRLYDAGCLSLTQARRWAEIERPDFETALIERGIPIHRPTVDDFATDLETIHLMRQPS